MTKHADHAAIEAAMDARCAVIAAVPTDVDPTEDWIQRKAMSAAIAAYEQVLAKDGPVTSGDTPEAAYLLGYTAGKVISAADVKALREALKRARADITATFGCEQRPKAEILADIDAALSEIEDR